MPREFPPNAVHLVRTTQQINVTLSQMADQKASILMGATFVVFTITISQAGRGGASPAMLVLALFSFIAAILAVTAVMPSYRPRATVDSNLLFFGNFTGISEEQFISEVLDQLSDDESAYRAMLRDIHQNGMVLQHKKYRFLSYAYRAFITGLVLTALVFAASEIGWRF